MIICSLNISTPNMIDLDSPSPRKNNAISSASMPRPPKFARIIINLDIPGLSFEIGKNEDDVIPQIGHQSNEFEFERIIDDEDFEGRMKRNK